METSVFASANAIEFVIAVPKICDEQAKQCFWKVEEGNTWAGAREACQSEGGDLAALHTEYLFDFANEKLQ